MIHPALRHLAWRQATGGLRHWARQLKRPRYFVPLLLVVGYFGLIFGPAALFRGEVDEARRNYAPLVGPFIGLFIALNLFMATRARSPAFSLPEAAQLFVMPFTRRDLVLYTLLRPQVGLVFTAGFLTLIFAAQARPGSPLLMGVGVFCVLNLMQCLGLCAALAFNRLAIAGAPRWLNYLPSIAMLLWVTAPPFVFSPPQGAGFLQWVENLRDGPVGAIHAPLHVMAGLLGFGSAAEFFTGLAGVIGACVLLVALALALIAPFEEAALANAEAVGHRVDALRKGGVPGLKLQGLKSARSTGLRLAPTGAPWVAALWASVIGEWRAGPWRMFLLGALLYVAFVGVLAVAGVDYRAWTLAAILPAAVILPMLVGLTRVMATSLRVEFDKLELLKTLPLGGRFLLRGRVWGAALASLAPLSLMALAIATAAMGANHWSLPWLMPAVICGLPLLAACVALMGAIESVLVLLMPAWMVGARGDMPLDQMGRTMAAFAAQWLLMGLLMIAPAIAGGLVGGGLAIAGLSEWAAIPGLIVATAAIVIECELMLAFAGRRYDLMDATEDMT